MFPNSRTVWTRVIFTLPMTGILALSLTSLAFAATSSSDIKVAQQTLLDKGYAPGPIDGVLGPQNRRAIGQYQKAEDLRVTRHLDAKTAGKLGVAQESVGGSSNDSCLGKSRQPRLENLQLIFRRLHERDAHA